MIVQVKLYALLRQYHPGPNRSEPMRVRMGAAATIRDLILELKLPAETVRAGFVNGEKQPLETALQDGDVVSLFSAVVGG